MLKKFGLFVALYFFQNVSYCQVTWCNPLPSGFTNNKVVFTNRNTGFIFKFWGDLARTSDQGSSWQVVHHFSDGAAFDIHDSTAVVAGWANNSALFYIS